MTSRLIIDGDLHLNGPVGFRDFDDEGFTVSDVAEALSELDGDITVKINSGGGDAFAAVAIYNSLIAQEGKITTVVQAIAASGASVIFMAGDERVLATGALLMIHDASGFTAGTEAAHVKAARNLGKLSEQMAGIYARQTGRDSEVERKAMRAETWLDGAEAVEAGLATEESDTSAVEASAFNYALYAHAPDRLLARAKGAAEQFGLDAVAAVAISIPRHQEMKMSETKKTSAATPQTKPADLPAPMTLDRLKAEHPDLIDAMLSEFGSDAAKAERDRIKQCQAVFGISAASEQVKALCFDGKSDAGAVALAILADAETKGSDHLATLAQQEADIVKAGLKATPVAAASDTKPKKATDPKGWTAEYHASPDLKAEFVTVEDYVALMEAEAAGNVRTIFGAKQAS